MRLIKFLLIAFITLNIGFAQNIKKRDIRLSHPLNPVNSNFQTTHKPYITVADTIDVYAVMVQFQIDSDPLTTGDGTFDMTNKYYNPATQRDTVVDSPPYDSAYFADHLLFMKNYYYKASKGKLVLRTHLLGNVFTLPKQMKQYSPNRGENNFKIGELFKDTWKSVDSVYNFSSLDSNKTAFVIFHAGVGRDINMSAIIGYDPTPYDIPSIFLGTKALKDIYGQNYEGYVTNSGFRIKTSLIIPSNELRELNLISGNFLLELGMNGILAANFGSYLGLPDLFNTNTGGTAIGRFGLMDGQSIMSYNGIFPPEPSAWEKVYLGWIQPITISNGSNYLNIKTSSVPYQQDSTMFKILISSQEYFLVENRIRNPFNTGQKVYTRNRAFRDSTLFLKDIETFINYNISDVKGNLIDVSYLDWSLPGSINDTGNFKGGILIWHIDENVINSKISSNTINNEIEHKGIDLEEAKGAQEIGVTFSTPFGDVTGDGTIVDYWFNGKHYVPSNIYKNEFTPGSFPNTLSYSLANNNIYFTEFDSIKEVMKFKISLGTNVLSPIAGFPKNLNLSSITALNNVKCFDIDGDGKDELFVNASNKLFGFKNDGTPMLNPDGSFISSYGSYPAGYAFSQSILNSKLLVLTNSNGHFGLFKLNNLFQPTDSLVFNSGFAMTSAPIIYDSTKVLFGFTNKVFSQSLNSGITGYLDSGYTATMFAKKSTSYVNANDKNLYNYVLTGNLISENSLDSVIIKDNKNIFVNGKQIASSYTTGQISNYPILADINKDGRQEILFITDKLYAVNGNGVLLDYFPARISGTVSSGIIAGDINYDGLIEVLFATSDGNLCAYNTSGKVVDGFPVKIGNGTLSSPSFFNYKDTLAIAVLAGDGYLYAFKTSQLYNENNILWKGIFNDKYLSNSNYKSLSSSVVYSDFLPAEKCYNWPNPVYNGKTFIRYFLNGTATSVTVKILDLSGELITTLTGTSYPKADNEVTWDVTNVQSGVYYGVIEATVNGSSERRIIKIAVVK